MESKGITFKFNYSDSENSQLFMVKLSKCPLGNSCGYIIFRVGKLIKIE
jgi:hypothetical protein